MSEARYRVTMNEKNIIRDGRLLGCRSQARVLGYPAGKAYARYLGCYEQEQLGSLLNALTDLTGGAADIFELCAGGVYARDP